MTAPWHLTAAEMDAKWDALRQRLAELEREKAASEGLRQGTAIVLMETQARLAAAEALRKDAKRYRWLRRGNYSIETARSILNDTAEGIDAAIDAAMEQSQ